MTEDNSKNLTGHPAMTPRTFKKYTTATNVALK